jgi:hypothetical protein
MQNPAQTSAAPFLVLCASTLLALSACMGQDKPAADATGLASVSATPATLLAQIQALEASGALPALDRSADIQGPDANNNGVRDDIEAWIAALPITETQKKAAMQEARAQQRMLIVDLTDRVALQSTADQMAASVVCRGDVFSPNFQDGSNLGAKIEAITANTRERARRYVNYNKARSGSSLTLPQGNTCEP